MKKILIALVVLLLLLSALPTPSVAAPQAAVDNQTHYQSFAINGIDWVCWDDGYFYCYPDDLN